MKCKIWPKLDCDGGVCHSCERHRHITLERYVDKLDNMLKLGYIDIETYAKFYHKRVVKMVRAGLI